MKILVINGPNINMLGVREPEVYGNEYYFHLVRMIKKHAKELEIKVKIVHSNEEGKIVTYIQRALNRYDGIIINPGAYTHTSIAILDALKAVNIPTVEVHISDPEEREEFRHFSYVSLVAKKTIKGQGLKGYNFALDYFKDESHHF